MLAFQKVLLIVIELILPHPFLMPQTVGQLGEEYYDYIRMEIQERSKGTTIYRTTGKGIALLRVYQRVRDLLSPDTATNNWFIDYRSSIPMWHNMQKK